jgi:hypothetical protein
LAAAVYVRGIEEIAAEVESMAESSDCFVRIRGPIGIREAEAAESKRSNLRAG